MVYFSPFLQGAWASLNLCPLFMDAKDRRHPWCLRLAHAYSIRRLTLPYVSPLFNA